MTDRRLPDILRHLKRVLVFPAATDCTDRQLLERFARQRDEMAFASLVWRHGPLVLGAGRRILHHEQDAEDVFQATFLILARKAASSRWQKSVAGWLYRVAYRLAIRMRTKTARERELDKKAGKLRATEFEVTQQRPTLYSVLDEELERLPERYREPLVFCYLGAKTRDQAARQLGWSLRTLERRLEQGLKLLRARLGKRGIELPMTLLAAGLSQQCSSASVTAAIVAGTVEKAVVFGSGTATGANAVSAHVLTLAEGGLKAMAMIKLKIGAAALLAATMVAAGVGLVGYRLPASEPVKKNRTVEERTTRPPAADVWPEGAIVRGRVVDHRGAAVANAEVLLLGEERIYVEADRRTWFVPQSMKDQPKPPSTQTNGNGEFTIQRTKGAANRLAVIGEDPLFWLVHCKSLMRGGTVEIELPPSGSLAVRCDLPGKAATQPVEIELRTFDGTDWNTDVLRFHASSFSVPNPGERIFDHLPPGQYSVERGLRIEIGKNKAIIARGDRHLLNVESNLRAAVSFDRKVGRPLTGQVRGLENIDLREAHVTINYWGPEEQFDPKYGQRVRWHTAFDMLPIQSDGRFTTDPIPPGKYDLFLFAVRSSSPEQSSQQSDFDGRLEFTVPETGAMPTVEVVATPRTRNTQFSSTDYRVRVVDDAGKPVPTLQARIHTAQFGYTNWIEGRAGIVYIAQHWVREVEAFDLLVRADGCAPSVVRFKEESLRELRRNEAMLTMQRGERIELRFRLPEGMTWPRDLMPETYFDDYRERAGMMRQPSNRQRSGSPDLNMLNLHPFGPGRFELRLAPETAPFYVAIHAPGFLQYFECGPFQLADAKAGTLEILVPPPARLDVHFDSSVPNTEEAPFKGAHLQVLRRIPGTTGSYWTVAVKETTVAAGNELRLTDLAPGAYRVRVETYPKEGEKNPFPTTINPGAFHENKEITLGAGQSVPIHFRYRAFDPHAYRGQCTALLRIRNPDGTVPKGHRVKVDYYDGHYGRIPVFSGTIPDSGECTLKGITDRAFSSSAGLSYTVAVDDEQLGHFSFTDQQSTQEFEFSLAPKIGDLAPDIEIRRIDDGRSMRLSRLRGKLVCLEFWAT